MEQSGVRPSFQATIKSVIAKPNQEVRFDARINGSKPMTVTWLKNGKKVLPGNHYRIAEQGDLHSLIIVGAQPDDEAKYECIVLNNYGQASCEAKCILQSAVSLAAAQGEAPGIVEPLKALIVKKGQSAVFKCRFSGNPPLQVKWYKAGRIVEPTGNVQISQNGDTNILTVNQVFPEDEGEYKCCVANQRGSAEVRAPLKIFG